MTISAKVTSLEGERGGSHSRTSSEIPLANLWEASSKKCAYQLCLCGLRQYLKHIYTSFKGQCFCLMSCSCVIQYDALPHNTCPSGSAVVACIYLLNLYTRGDSVAGSNLGGDTLCFTLADASRLKKWLTVTDVKLKISYNNETYLQIFVDTKSMHLHVSCIFKVIMNNGDIWRFRFAL